MSKKEDVSQLKDDVYVIKRVVKETNVTVRDHERRITKLEKIVIT